jgi:hypothetical protein
LKKIDWEDDMPSIRSLHELDEWERSRFERLARGLDAAEQIRRQVELRDAFSSAAMKFTGFTGARLPDHHSSRSSYADSWRNARAYSAKFLSRLIGPGFYKWGFQIETTTDVRPE